VDVYSSKREIERKRGERETERGERERDREDEALGHI